MWKKRILALGCVVFPILAGLFFGFFVVTPYKVLMCTLFVCAVLISAYFYFYITINKKKSIQIEELKKLFSGKEFIEVTLNTEYYSELGNKRSDILIVLLLDTCQEKGYLKFYAYLQDDYPENELCLFPIFISVETQDGDELCGEYIKYEKFLKKYTIKNS